MRSFVWDPQGVSGEFVEALHNAIVGALPSFYVVREETEPLRSAHALAVRPETTG